LEENHSQQEIDTARTLIEADLHAYRNLPTTAKTTKFESAFFKREVLALEYMFVHRLTGIEEKDGNPLNELRVLCNSILLKEGKLRIDKLPADVCQGLAEASAGEVCAQTQGRRRNAPL